jgi:hypothetical protein
MNIPRKIMKRSMAQRTLLAGRVVLVAATALSQDISPHPIMTTEEAIRKDLKALRGTWIVVAAERDGRKLSDAEIESIAFTVEETGRAWVKKKGQIIFEGLIKIDLMKNPKTERQPRPPRARTRAKPS